MASSALRKRRRISRPLLCGLLVPAALIGSLLATQPVAGQSLNETVRYRITLTGLFDADALASGTAVPSGVGFSGVVGGSHNIRATFWESGAAASAGLEEMAETGNFRAFRSEVDDAKEYGGTGTSFRSPWGSVAATGEETMTFVTTRVHPLVTVVAMISPSPDWFVGVSELSLRRDGEWISSQTIDLYPWDAGTEDGSDFDTSNPETSPQGTVTSLRNSGPFSDNPIARLTISLETPLKVRNVSTTPGDGALTVQWKPTTGAARYKIQWTSGDQSFETAESDGRQHLVEGGQTTSYTIPDLENGTKYKVRVIATNVAGDGRPSAQIKGTPVDPRAGTTLVANVGQDPALTSQLTLSASTPQYLQAFSTGDEGADLGEITLPNLRNVQPDTEFGVSIYSENGGSRGTLLHTLEGPSTLETGLNATFAPTDGETVTLAPNTTYFLQIDHIAGSLSLLFTKSDGEDIESDPGWTLADRCLSRDQSATAFAGCVFSKALRVTISGDADDGLPKLSVSDASVVEGSNLEFTVTLSEAASETVTVDYSTSDGTATADANATDGADYTAASGQTLTFAAGDTTKTISIATGDDTVDEDDETLTVTLSNPSETAKLGSIASGTGIIVNNDETPATDATLSAFSLTAGDGSAIALSPSFSRYGFQYTASVANDVDSLTASVTANRSDADVVIVGDDDTTSPNEAAFDLDVGSNLVKVMVTSSDGSRTKIYMAVVTRAASTDATLSALTLTDSTSTAISLTPATFDPTITDYTASVAKDISSATVTATTSHDGASVQIITADGTTLGASATVDLDPGDNFIKLMVTAEDDSTAKVYNVFVAREVDGTQADATLSAFELEDDSGVEVLPWASFGPAVTLNDASVANSVTSVTATVTTSQGAATLQFFDGDATGTVGQVTRDLEVGNNRIKVMVTAPDGRTTKIYIVTVIRAASDASSDATLSSLSATDPQGTDIALDPATFDPATTDYTASVASDVDSVTVSAAATDADAVALIFDAAGSRTPHSATVDLEVGDNPIKVMVNAADATTAQIYNLTVTRADPDAADDATLSSLSLADAEGAALDLSPSFDPATTDYTAAVAYSSASIVLGAAKNHGGATVAIIEADGTSTPDEATVDLSIGENVIKVMVTSEDASDALVYRITVTRAPAWSATLTVGTRDSYVPAQTGYLLWGDARRRTRASNPSSSTGGGYRVISVMRFGGGLYLNIKRALPGDFTLRVGDQDFVASESLGALQRRSGDATGGLPMASRGPMATPSRSASSPRTDHSRSRDGPRPPESRTSRDCRKATMGPMPSRSSSSSPTSWIWTPRRCWTSPWRSRTERQQRRRGARPAPT